MADVPGEKVSVIWASWEGARVEAECARHVLMNHLYRHLPPGTIGFAMEARKPTAEACTDLVKAALDSGTDWVLYVDDDICTPPDVYFRLREHADPVERPVVSALGFFKEPPYFPSIFKYDGWDGTGVPTIGTPMVDLDFPENQLIKVDGCGMTCMLIHRSVFDRIEKPWFQTAGPDGWFNRQLWYAKIPTYLHTGIIVDHLFTGRANLDAHKKWVKEHGIDSVRRAAVQHFRLNKADWPKGEFELEEPIPADAGPLELGVGRTL